MPALPIPRVSVSAPFVDATGRLTPEARALLDALAAFARRVNDHDDTLVSQTDALAALDGRVTALEP